jgi:hypothetical protein
MLESRLGRTMNQSRLYVVGIAAFVLGVAAGVYFVPQIGRDATPLRESVQQLNHRFRSVSLTPRFDAPEIPWINPPELDRPVLWILYILVPPIAVAAILGLWTKTVFWSLDQLPSRLKQLRFPRPIDFKPKPYKAKS